MSRNKKKGRVMSKEKGKSYVEEQDFWPKKNTNLLMFKTHLVSVEI